MKVKFLALAFCIVSSFTACDSLKQIASSIRPSDVEMALGLKQALEQGLFRSFDAFQNPQVNPVLAFAFPGDAQKIVNTLNNLGLGSYVDKVTGKFNHAASSAFIAAKPIFLNSLRSMNISDAAGILITDNDHAATDYFKANTRTELTAAFRPIADSTIKVEGADKDWAKIANAINNIPFANLKVENSLTDFVAARAVDGMYLMVAQEEEKIRKDVNFRKTDLMKRVFGYADEQLRLKGTTGAGN
jgi:tRNA(Leu) C34 or U34 (ribose-2'-O)-methylase TrmL